MTSMRYAVFAYGSNLETAQMSARCPTARRAARATLREHELVFGGFSQRWNGAVANVRRAHGRHVAGLLYLMDANALRALDRFEGVPFAYERVVRYVVDEHGQRRRAQVYVQPEDGFEAWAPGAKYLTVIARAYRRLGFDRRLLMEAVCGAGR